MEPLFAGLDAIDYLGLGILLMILGIGTASLRGGDAARLARMERKLDRMLNHLGITGPDVEYEWQRLAKDPARKIEAIAAHRQELGSSLAEAKHAVEEYLARTAK